MEMKRHFYLRDGVSDSIELMSSFIMFFDTKTGWSRQDLSREGIWIFWIVEMGMDEKVENNTNLYYFCYLIPFTEKVVFSMRGKKIRNNFYQIRYLLCHEIKKNKQLINHCVKFLLRYTLQYTLSLYVILNETRKIITSEFY
ncbi:hypothetical protein BpHYR1_010106 [Brachionus plicatilis]|uniref:Uncharacterized protein n=1 Tax=Brachionus plicatilis TaxID=10195 RepID=A0A3M7S7D5_BRAPC|nr:hypothetical protein BpHYR1_010106 [Brachionus plicatilis]